MTTYRITLYTNTDYCELKPSDTDCHYSVTVKAKDKYHAVWDYLYRLREERKIILQVRSKELVPKVWSVDVVQ